MELIKKNIHMDRIRNQAVSQITLEDDINVPEQKEDISSIIFEKGTVLIDEVRPGVDAVYIRGRLVYDILYQTGEGSGGLVCLQGKLPFDEKVNLQEIRSIDNVMAEGSIEDLSIHMINSRKLNLQTVLTLQIWAEELYDEELPIGIYGEEAAQYRKEAVSPAQITVCKNDIFRVKEEIGLPGNYPNIFQILWSDVTLGDMDLRVLEGRINMSGELKIFLLYEGEGELRPIRSLEQILPINGSLECHGCQEGMAADIRCILAPQDHGQPYLTVRPDADGEERRIGVDLVLNIGIKLYEEERIEMLTDLYGVSKEIEALRKPCELRSLLGKITGKTRISERVRVRNGSGVLQLLYSEGKPYLEEQTAQENGIRISGSLQVRGLYITGSDETPYSSFQTQIPYHYTLEVPGMKPEDMGTVRVCVEQLQITMLDGEEMDVKAVLAFSTIVFSSRPREVIREVQVHDLDPAVMDRLPGMAVYVVKKGDNLWNIGRRYYLPVDRIIGLNQLESEELKPGQKLLLVK